MKTLLIQPPQGDPAQPYTSLSILQAAWKKAGIETVIKDINVDFFNYLCSDETIREHSEIIRQRLGKSKYIDQAERDVLNRADLIINAIQGQVQNALKVLRDKEKFYDPFYYSWAIRLISRNLEAISAVYYPGKVSLQSFLTAYSHLSSFDIDKAVDDRRTNAFVNYCDKIVKRQILDIKPDILAVSVTFQTQIIPAFTLASKVKQWLPGIKVVFGGGAITRIHHKLFMTPHLFKDVDAFIIYEGETAFPLLIEEWRKGKSGLSAPNVIIKTSEKISQSELIHVEDMNELPPPDHTGIDLKDYWWPEPALLVNCTRGCYWGKCAFCQISQATSGGKKNFFRIRDVDKVVSDILFIQKQTGAKAFNFSVDAIPPKTLLELSNAIIKNNISISWDTEIRLENGLTKNVLEKMSEAGCKYLRFGFESESERVRKIMNKGTTNAVTNRILMDCKEVGITVSLMCQIGFPEETKEESLSTAYYLKSVSNNVAFISIVPFVLEHGSIIYNNPDKYNIRILENPEDEDLSWMYNYAEHKGNTTTDNYDTYTEIEHILDSVFPDRDLFFKGGLGHAHTSLYTRKYPFKTFIDWNKKSFRDYGKLENKNKLRTAAGLSVKPEEILSNNKWNKFNICSAEVPEKISTIHGSALLLLAACIEPQTLDDIILWTKYLSGNQYTFQESKNIIKGLYEVGILLGTYDDNRQVSWMKKEVA